MRDKQQVCVGKSAFVKRLALDPPPFPTPGYAASVDMQMRRSRTDGLAALSLPAATRALTPANPCSARRHSRGGPNGSPRTLAYHPGHENNGPARHARAFRENLLAAGQSCTLDVRYTAATQHAASSGPLVVQRRRSRARSRWRWLSPRPRRLVCPQRRAADSSCCACSSRSWACDAVGRRARLRHARDGRVHRGSRCGRSRFTAAARAGRAA
jgi:hypothetical protein